MATSGLVLFDGRLTDSFAGSVPVLLSAERLTVDFVIDVTAEAVVQWYLAFTPDDPNAQGAIWRQEVAEEDVGNGVVHMPKVIRDFTENGGAALAVGQHAFTCQFIRSHNIARVYVRVSSGAVDRCVITAPFGASALSP